MPYFSKLIIVDDLHGLYLPYLTERLTVNSYKCTLYYIDYCYTKADLTSDFVHSLTWNNYNMIIITMVHWPPSLLQGEEVSART